MNGGNPRVLITGVKGLIGTILRFHLAESFDLYGLDRFPASESYIYQADITQADQVSSVFKACSPLKYVVHLAADPNSDAPWDSVLGNNINGTWNVFLQASRRDVKRIVFASSNHVTGSYEGNPPTLHHDPNPPRITITDPIRPDGPYGISKAAGEAIARYFYDHHGLEAVCLRIGSVLKDDDPTQVARHRATWLSHRDLRQLVERSLMAEEHFPGFGIYYGVSRNGGRFWDISNAERELEYNPQDDASRL